MQTYNQINERYLIRVKDYMRIVRTELILIDSGEGYEYRKHKGRTQKQHD